MDLIFFPIFKLPHHILILYIKKTNSQTSLKEFISNLKGHRSANAKGAKRSNYSFKK